MSSLTPSKTGRPPGWFWALPALVAALRGVPFIGSFFATAPEGQRLLHIGYVPKDFLMYAAFVRQAGEESLLVWHNPFTTEPHEPRFVGLLHALLGLIVRGTAAELLVVLDLIRIPLCFGFFAVLWWFVTPIFEDRRDRIWACVLVAFAGGIDTIARFLSPEFSEPIRLGLQQNTWQVIPQLMELIEREDIRYLVFPARPVEFILQTYPGRVNLVHGYGRWSLVEIAPVTRNDSDGTGNR